VGAPGPRFLLKEERSSSHVEGRISDMMFEVFILAPSDLVDEHELPGREPVPPS
jgi:hypothetical protein